MQFFGTQLIKKLHVCFFNTTNNIINTCKFFRTKHIKNITYKFLRTRKINILLENFGAYNKTYN